MTLLFVLLGAAFAAFPLKDIKMDDNLVCIKPSTLIIGLAGTTVGLLIMTIIFGTLFCTGTCRRKAQIHNGSYSN